MKNRLRRLLDKFLEGLARLLGIRVLTREQTIAVLSTFRIAEHPVNRVYLPTVPNSADRTKDVFAQTEAITHPAYVWDFTPEGKRIWQFPYGNVLVGKQLLCVNFGSQHWLKNIVALPKRKTYVAKTVVVPWSHYVDGVAYGGYYDFLLLVAAELGRMKDALPETVFRQAAIAYPLFDKAYERELWSLLGIDANQIVDSRRYAVRAERVVLGNNGHWYYPNLADVQSLKKHVEGRLGIKRMAQNRIYVSRVGRRQIVNEAELVDMLRKYQFTILDDQPRTVAEQVAIYKNASFIMGPHGASFSNVVWCEPGTHLFELFSSKYAPSHFRYLAAVMQMTYSAYYQGEKGANQHAELDGDIYVSVHELEQCLIDLLAK